MISVVKSVVTKRSVVLGKRKTSVSLEEPFWNELRAIAGAQGEPMSSLVGRIDADRKNANLSSAIRVFVLQHVRKQINAPHEQPTSLEHLSAAANLAMALDNLDQREA